MGSKYQLGIVLAAIVSSLSFHPTCFADAESNSEKDELEIALEKREVLRERLKLANDEFESVKKSVSNPSGSAAEQIEIQYKLKKMQREFDALMQELKDNASDIKKQKRLKDLWILWTAAIENSPDVNFMFGADKYVYANKDKIMKMVFEKVVPRNTYDQSIFFGPQCVVDTIPSEVINESSRALLLSMQENEKRRFLLSMLFDVSKNLVSNYFDYERATNEKDRQHAHQRLVDFAGQATVDEILNHNR